ncbi:hypothetical protein D3233_01550, partial [Staphylococcus aureus]
QCKMYLGHVKVLLGMFLSLKTLYRKRTVIWPFYFYTIIRTLSSIAWLLSIILKYYILKLDRFVFVIFSFHSCAGNELS